MFNRWVMLLISIIMDIIGYGTYTFPLVGEVVDIVFAPIQAVFIMYFYGSTGFALFGLFEELTPGFDFFPTCTMAWLKFYGGKSR